MRHALIVALLWSTMAGAQKKGPSATQAKAANEAAFKKALAKLKMKPVVLSSVPAEPDEGPSDAWFIGNVVFDRNGHHDPTFVVDGNKGVFRVVKKLLTVGRVKARVCHAGPQRPIRVKRTRFDVPSGHTFKGDIEVAFDAVVLDEQNTCK